MSRSIKKQSPVTRQLVFNIAVDAGMKVTVAPMFSALLRVTTAYLRLKSSDGISSDDFDAIIGRAGGALDEMNKVWTLKKNQHKYKAMIADVEKLINLHSTMVRTRNTEHKELHSKLEGLTTELAQHCNDGHGRQFNWLWAPIRLELRTRALAVQYDMRQTASNLAMACTHMKQDYKTVVDGDTVELTGAKDLLVCDKELLIAALGAKAYFEPGRSNGSRAVADRLAKRRIAIDKEWSETLTMVGDTPLLHDEVERSRYAANYKSTALAHGVPEHSTSGVLFGERYACQRPTPFRQTVPETPHST